MPNIKSSTTCFNAAFTNLLGRLGAGNHPIGINYAATRVSGIASKSRTTSLGPFVASSANGGSTTLLRPLTGRRASNAKVMGSGGLRSSWNWRRRQSRRPRRTGSGLACRQLERREKAKQRSSLLEQKQKCKRETFLLRNIKSTYRCRGLGRFSRRCKGINDTADAGAKFTHHSGTTPRWTASTSGSTGLGSFTFSGANRAIFGG